MKKPRLTQELHCFHCFLSRPTPPVPKTFGLFCFMALKIAFIIKQTLAMITSQMSNELFLIAADSSHPSGDHPCVRRQGCHDSGQSMQEREKPENCLWNKHCWSFLPASHQIAIFNLHHSSKNHESDVCQIISQQTREDLVLLQVPIAPSPCKK